MILCLLFLAWVQAQAADQFNPARHAFALPSDLHVLDANQRGSLRWLVWARRRADGRQVVKLSLVERLPHGGSHVLQTIARDDAYEPDIRRVSDWSVRGGGCVFVLSYQQGAAAVQLELYGLVKGRVLRLGEISGEAAGWRIGVRGHTELGVYDRQDGAALRAQWYAWDANRMRLAERPSE